MKEEGAKAISIFMAFSFVFFSSYRLSQHSLDYIYMWQILNAFRPSWWQLTINYLNLFINFFVFFYFCRPHKLFFYSLALSMLLFYHFLFYRALDRPFVYFFYISSCAFFSFLCVFTNVSNKQTIKNTQMHLFKT